jgi:hypothetical protein
MTMHFRNRIKKSHVVKLAATAAACGLLAAPTVASHSWGNYHWARAAGTELTMTVGDNVDSRWDSYLVTANADWNKSTVIQSPLGAGMTNPKNCRAVSGRIEVCNSAYGYNGWLGIAQIWTSGGHIVQAITKVNDSYYNSPTYNTPAWRAAVMCQEIGHDYGLGHQDENQNDDRTNSCMEYTNNPVGNEHPDFHDYDQLLLIYNHSESTASTAASRTAGYSAEGGNTPANWGRAVSFNRDGNPNVYALDMGNGRRMFTHVTWAIGEGPKGHDHD